MVVIKRLSECTFQEALQAWNEGFEGYFSNMTFTMDRYVKKLGAEGLSPDLSVVAFDGEKPIGFILSGIRLIDGKKVAWNGGTGVSTPYRGKGIGKQLMDAALDVYRAEEVDIATLEAISQNENAIKLYERCGYEVVDTLVILQREGAFEGTPFQSTEKYQLKTGIPADVIQLPFFQSMTTWQTQWNSVQNGESLTVYDNNGEEVGYAIYNRAVDPQGNKAAVIIQQCEAKPGREDAKEIINALLSAIFAPFDWVGRRMTFNMSEKNTDVITVLEEHGFTPMVKQVNMSRIMEQKSASVENEVAATN